MNNIINHNRFKKKYSFSELSKIGPWDDKKIFKFPYFSEKYFNFFNTYAKQNYSFSKTKCLCENDNDILLSQTDRHGVEFPTVVCKECGLIRAMNYLSDENTKDFYKNYYRPGKDSISINYGKNDPENFFNENFKNSKFRFDLISSKIKKIHNQKILDLGGGIGAVLNHFSDNNELYLADYFEPYLNFAKSKGINVIKGGLDEINFKPDIIILSHVIEHWSNFREEIQKLIKIQKIGETINYIEFPGIDSLKLGRRSGDIIGDIHIPHVYYFTSYVFENLMNRYGFEKLYIDSEIKSLFIYTGRKLNLTNNYEKVFKDILLAEKKRKIQCIKNFLKLFIPSSILKIIRKNPK